MATGPARHRYTGKAQLHTKLKGVGGPAAGRGPPCGEMARPFRPLEHVAHRLSHLLARVRGRYNGLRSRVQVRQALLRAVSTRFTELLPPRALDVVDASLAGPPTTRLHGAASDSAVSSTVSPGRWPCQEKKHQRTHVLQRRAALVPSAPHPPQPKPSSSGP